MSKKIKQEIYNLIHKNFKEYDNIQDSIINIDIGLKEIVKRHNFSKNKALELKKEIFKRFSPLKKEDIKEKIIKSFDLKNKLEEYESFILCQKTKFFNSNFNIDKEIEEYKKELIAKERDNLAQELIEDIIKNFYQHTEARKKERKIYYHAGPTNSGKTYAAIQKLKNSDSGCYLAPLRLLAWEKHEELSEDKLTALITGEESIKPDGYSHSSSTIEMANFNREYDIAVIDEIQMISDEKRGWAWTKSLLNINANEVHLCGDISAYEIVKDLISKTGDRLELINYERKTKLSYLGVVDEKKIEKGDAIIVFSRKEALAQKDFFENLGFKVAIIYGMMSPEVRKEQANLFLNGEKDLVVSTDAIGMGLNLPIKRVIFTRVTKYYDKKEHLVTLSELKQIAGRAGRYNLYPEGFVCVYDQKNNSRLESLDEIIEHNQFMEKRIKGALGSTLAQSKHAILGPDIENFNILNDKLKKEFSEMSIVEFLRFFQKINHESIFKKADISDLLSQSELVSFISKSDEYSSIWKFSIAPVLLRSDEHMDYFENTFKEYFNTRLCKKPNFFISENLQEMEILLRKIELYQWLKNQFGENIFYQDIKDDKNKLVEHLNKLIN